MLQLSPDKSFDFELLRALGQARYSGSDIAEILEAASKIEPGNFESWYQVFYNLAELVRLSVNPEESTHYPISVRDGMFRASTYYRLADFFLHGQKADSRITTLWASQTECFDLAISLLPIPGERIIVQANGFEIPTIFYRATASASSRPTILMGNGYDGSQEELLHMSGLAALERNFHVITYEGPGHPTVLRTQGLGFITEWEKVVSPVLDHYIQLPEIDATKIGLIGYSFGGFLAPRAAAFEPRLAAVMCVDGLFDVYESFAKMLPKPAKDLIDAHQKSEFDDNIFKYLPPGGTKMRWGLEQGLWSFQVASGYDLFDRTRSMTMEGVAGQIACPVLVCEAEEDHFFGGEGLSQPRRLANAIGPRATYVKFTAKEAASAHCHVGASVRLNQVVMNWFQDVVDGVK